MSISQFSGQVYQFVGNLDFKVVFPILLQGNNNFIMCTDINKCFAAGTYKGGMRFSIGNFRSGNLKSPARPPGPEKFLLC
jgi:hypothetical protein